MADPCPPGAGGRGEHVMRGASALGPAEHWLQSASSAAGCRGDLLQLPVTSKLLPHDAHDAMGEDMCHARERPCSTPARVEGTAAIEALRSHLSAKQEIDPMQADRRSVPTWWTPPLAKHLPSPETYRHVSGMQHLGLVLATNSSNEVVYKRALPDSPAANLFECRLIAGDVLIGVDNEVVFKRALPQVLGILASRTRFSLLFLRDVQDVRAPAGERAEQPGLEVALEQGQLNRIFVTVTHDKGNLCPGLMKETLSEDIQSGPHTTIKEYTCTLRKQIELLEQQSENHGTRDHSTPTDALASSRAQLEFFRDFLKRLQGDHAACCSVIASLQDAMTAADRATSEHEGARRLSEGRMSQLENKCMDLKEQLARRQDEISRLEDIQVQHERETASLKDEVEAKEREVSQLSKDLERTSLEFLAKLDRSTEQVGKLEEQIGLSAARESSLRKLTIQQSQLVAEMQQQAREMEELRVALEVSQNDLTSHEAQVAELQGKVASSTLLATTEETERRRLEAEVGHLSSRAEALEQSLVTARRLQQDAETLQGKHACAMHDAERKLEHALEQQQREGEQRAAELIRLTRELDEARLQLTEAGVKAQVEADERQRLIGEAGRLREAYEASSVQQRQLEAQLQQQAREMEELRYTFEMEESRHTIDLSRMVRQMTQVAEDAEEVERMLIETCTRQQTRLDLLASSVQNLVAEKTGLQHDLALLKREAATLKDDVEAKEKKNSKLSKDLERTSLEFLAKLDRSAEQVGKLEEQIGVLTARETSLAEQLDARTLQLSAAAGEIASYRTRAMDLEAKLLQDSSSTTLTLIEEERSRQKAEALELKKQLVEAKNDLALAEITIDENGKIFEELQSELDEARARESKLQTQMLELEERLKNQIKAEAPDPSEQLTPKKKIKAAQLDFAKCALRTGEAGEEICKIRDKIDEIRQRIHVCIWAPHLPVVKSQLLQNKTTIGLNLDMACKVTRVLIGGPAFESERIHEGDTLLAIDGHILEGHQMDAAGLLRGNDSSGSPCVLVLRKADTGEEIEVTLHRVENDVLAHKRQMWEVLVHLDIRFQRYKDKEGTRLMQVVKDLWQKTLLEVHEHEDRCEINILQQQRECSTMLDQLSDLLRDHLLKSSCEPAAASQDLSLPRQGVVRTDFQSPVERQ